MENRSKVIFKEIMASVKEFEQLGNKWCTDNDVNAVARARSYGKKIMNAMKPFIESSITEADIMIVAEATKPTAAVVEEVKVVEELPVEVPPVVEEVTPVETTEEPIVVKQETKILSDKKEVEVKNKGFNFNKRK